jgi:hypothetical protein
VASKSLEFRLESGRAVRLDQLHVVPASAGWSDVGPTSGMDERIREFVASLCQTENPPVLVKPERSNLIPPWICFASFDSEPLEKRGVCVQCSFLIICWFTESIDASVRNLACGALAGISWEQHARDYHSDW